MYRLAAPVAQKSMQGEEDRHAPQQVPEVEKALRILQQDEKEDEEEAPGVDKGTAAVDRKVLARTGPHGTGARPFFYRGPVCTQGGGQKDTGTTGCPVPVSYTHLTLPTI